MWIMLKSVVNPLFMRKIAVDKSVKMLWIKWAVFHIFHNAEKW